MTTIQINNKSVENFLYKQATVNNLSTVDYLTSLVMNEIEFLEIKKDKNLKLDPYFYQRQKQLKQDIDDIDCGRAQMISNEDFWNEIDKYVDTLQK